MGVLVLSPQTTFLPHFPFLTMEGEFVVKNLVLLGAAGALWLGHRAATSNTRPLKPLEAVVALAGAAVLGLLGARVHGALRSGAHLAADAVAPLPAKASFVRALAQRSSTLMVEGVVVDRCPLFGCWMIVRDETGPLFVDLAPEGLRADALAPGTRVRVTGRIGPTREGNIGFVATGFEPEGGAR
jgi:hypothetical protein